MIDDFYSFSETQGIARNAFYEEKGDGFTVVTFSEEGETDCLYNVAIVFFDDNNLVEVYVRKYIKNYDEFTLLKRINDWNCKYSGITFFIDDDMLTIKSHFTTGGDIDPVLKEMVDEMSIAKEEFPLFS